MRSPKQEIERYLRTGEHDDQFTAWPGSGLPARPDRAYADLRHALVSAVKSRTAKVILPQQLFDLDVRTLAHQKVQPMVDGLFPAIERQPVLDMLSRSLVFLPTHHRTTPPRNAVPIDRLEARQHLPIELRREIAR